MRKPEIPVYGREKSSGAGTGQRVSNATSGCQAVLPRIQPVGLSSFSPMASASGPRWDRTEREYRLPLFTKAALSENTARRAFLFQPDGFSLGSSLGPDREGVPAAPIYQGGPLREYRS